MNYFQFLRWELNTRTYDTIYVLCLLYNIIYIKRRARTRSLGSMYYGLIEEAKRSKDVVLVLCLKQKYIRALGV